ncbi:MAG: hypothetical protein QM765_21535 [Myxococcales bacterium]
MDRSWTDLQASFGRAGTLCLGFLRERELIHHLKNEQAALSYALQSLTLRLKSKARLETWLDKLSRATEQLDAHFAGLERGLGEAEAAEASSGGDGTPPARPR